MRPLRRATSLVVTLFLMNLSLVEAGFACAASTPSMRVMAGIAMDASTTRDAQVTQKSEDGTPARDCEFPWAPGGCQSMVPCAPTTLAAASAVFAQSPALRSDIPRLVVSRPPSLTRPPELPPPRA